MPASVGHSELSEIWAPAEITIVVNRLSSQLNGSATSSHASEREKRWPPREVASAPRLTCNPASCSDPSEARRISV